MCPRPDKLPARPYSADGPCFLDAGNQPLLLRPGQFLDGRLPPEGGGAVRERLLVHQLQRTPPPGVFGSFARPVGGQDAVGAVLQDDTVGGLRPQLPGSHCLRSGGRMIGEPRGRG